MPTARRRSSACGKVSPGWGSRAGAGRDAGGDDPQLERLERLEKLHADGVLDDEEFRAEKARILAGDKHTTEAGTPAI